MELDQLFSKMHRENQFIAAEIDHNRAPLGAGIQSSLINAVLRDFEDVKQVR